MMSRGVSDQECANQIFTLKQMCEKVWEKKQSVHASFRNLQKEYDNVNTPSSLLELRMGDVGDKLLNVIYCINIR